MRVCLSALATVLLLIGGASNADAGIYNMQSILATEADEGLSGAIRGSADWHSGNVDYLFLSATPLARYRKDRHLFIGMMRGDHKTSGDTTIISNTLEHVRYRFKVSDFWLGEVFVQHEFNDVKRLNLRALVGLGPMFSLLSNKTYGINVGISYMLEYEKLRDDELGDSRATDWQHRNSSYLSGHYELDDRVQLVESIYLQPRLTDTRDLRFLSATQLSFRITEKLSYSTALTIAYDTRPPQTVKKLDTALVSSLTLSL